MCSFVLNYISILIQIWGIWINSYTSNANEQDKLSFIVLYCSKCDVSCDYALSKCDFIFEKELNFILIYDVWKKFSNKQGCLKKSSEFLWIAENAKNELSTRTKFSYAK